MRAKKVLSVLAALSLASTLLVGCGQAAAPAETKAPAESNAVAETQAPVETKAQPESNELVIYAAGGTQEELDVYITEFEKQTGINVEIVNAGTGELLKRIEAESENPLADVQWGGTVSVALPYADYFEPYVSVNEDDQIDACKAVAGTINCNTILPICMIVNTELIGDIEVKGYQDLLNPELKGKIAYVDPAQSSTGMQHLTNMLAAIGAEDEEKGWEFVDQLIDNLDGKMLSSSSAVGQGVADGEYVVGLTHENYVSQLMKQGYPVEPIYQEEGFFVSTGGLQIVKGCKNLENAKKFIDYMTSKDTQERAVEVLNVRGSRKDAPAPEGLPSLDGKNVLVEDVYKTLENSQAYLERFKDLYTD